MFIMERKSLVAKIGSKSPVGIKTRGGYPLAFGNYCWLFDGPYVVNMWAENIVEARFQFLTNSLIEGFEFKENGGSWFVVDDSRIPEAWYNNKFCWTGYGTPSAECAEQMYKIHGDPYNELEMFTDPESYWNKRGWVYDKTTGVRSREVMLEEENNASRSSENWKPGTDNGNELSSNIRGQQGTMDLASASSVLDSGEARRSEGSDRDDEPGRQLVSRAE